MKLTKGEFSYGKTVEIEYEGKTIKRKVHYGILDGCYVIIDNEKIGERTLTKNQPEQNRK